MGGVGVGQTPAAARRAGVEKPVRDGGFYCCLGMPAPRTPCLLLPLSTHSQLLYQCGHSTPASIWPQKKLSQLFWAGRRWPRSIQLLSGLGSLLACGSLEGRVSRKRADPSSGWARDCWGDFGDCLATSQNRAGGHAALMLSVPWSEAVPVSFCPRL